MNISTHDRQWRLAGKNLTREQVLKLCTFLKDYPLSTEQLFLSQNNLDDFAVKHIAAALRDNVYIKSLFLQTNSYHEHGIKSLCEMLKYNKVQEKEPLN